MQDTTMSYKHILKHLAKMQTVCFHTVVFLSITGMETAQEFFTQAFTTYSCLVVKGVSLNAFLMQMLAALIMSFLGCNPAAFDGFM